MGRFRHVTLRALPVVWSTAIALTLAGLAAAAAPAPTATVELRPGLTPSRLAAAEVIRVGRGVRAGSLAALRDDQTIETPSGHRMTVKRFRTIRALIAQAHLRAARPRAAGFAILPAPKTAGTPRKAGETAAQLLARPPGDVVRLATGHSVSVAQLRAMAPWVQRRYAVDLHGPARPVLTGPATAVTSVAQLKTLPKNAPDETVLESRPAGRAGTRITLGQLKRVLRAQRGGVPQVVR